MVRGAFNSFMREVAEDQWTGFYMIGTSVMKELRPSQVSLIKCFAELVNDYNHGHNIMRIFDVLRNFPFTASETKSDY